MNLTTKNLGSKKMKYKKYYIQLKPGTDSDAFNFLVKRVKEERSGLGDARAVSSAIKLLFPALSVEIIGKEYIKKIRTKNMTR